MHRIFALEKTDFGIPLYIKYKSNEIKKNGAIASIVFSNSSFVLLDHAISIIFQGAERTRICSLEVENDKELQFPRTVYEALKNAASKNTGS